MTHLGLGRVIRDRSTDDVDENGLAVIATAIAVCARPCARLAASYRSRIYNLPGYRNPGVRNPTRILFSQPFAGGLFLDAPHGVSTKTEMSYARKRFAGNYA